MTLWLQQALSCVLGWESMAEKQCTWWSPLPFLEALLALWYHGMLSIFMATATRKSHMKFAPSFTSDTITLCNVPHIKPRMRHSFRIWFQEKKKYKKFFSPWGTYCQTSFFFFLSSIGTDCNWSAYILLSWYWILLQSINPFNLYFAHCFKLFWERVEVNELNK